MNACLPYQKLADYYDAIYSFKNYQTEARRVEQLIRRFGRARSRTLLDVACGTGRHLAYWSRHFDCVGLDSSRAMLRIARRRLLGVDLLHGDMRTFDLSRKFDAVTCMFSAIGYVRDLRELRATLRNFAHHLNPEGVVVVEPWLGPETFVAGHPSLLAYDTPDLKIARVSYSLWRRRRPLLEMHYLVAKQGKGIRHFSVTYSCPLFRQQQMLAAFRSAGFRPHFFARGFSPGRGLYVGTLRPPSVER